MFKNICVNFYWTVGNTTLSGRSSPTLSQLLIDSAKQIPNPSKDEISAGRKTVFDTWLANDPNLNYPAQPKYALITFFLFKEKQNKKTNTLIRILICFQSKFTSLFILQVICNIV